MAFGVSVTSAVELHACGDKFLVRLERESRGTNIPLAMAPRQANILVYRPADSDHPPELRDVATLTRVGHQVQMCDSATRCSEALTSGAFQIVLADYRDLEALNDQPTPGTRLIPVTSGVSRGEYKRIKERFGVVFDSAAPTGKLLAMVDRLTATR
jgi:hypothetical protein